MKSVSRIEDLADWMRAFGHPSTLTELAVLLACVALAWGFVWLVRRATRNHDSTSIWFGRTIVDGVMFPFVLLCLAYGARSLVDRWTTLAVFKLALPVLVALLVIRVGVKVLQVAFREAPVVRILERTISWVAWIAMVLWVSGLLPVHLIRSSAVKPRSFRPFASVDRHLDFWDLFGAKDASNRSKITMSRWSKASPTKSERLSNAISFRRK